jgi:hypothetical protein
MRIFRPFVGTAVAVGALAGGLALGLSLTGASAATAASTTAASTTAAHTAKAATGTSAARPAVSATAARLPKGKCTHMSGGSQAYQGRGNGPTTPGRPGGSPAASS